MKNKQSKEIVNHKTRITIEKFANDEAVKKGISYDKSVLDAFLNPEDNNMLVNAGINAFTNLLAGAGGTAFNNANSYIGVGDSSTAESAAQTDLQAATNKLRKAMNATYPLSGTSQKITFQADFTSAEANYAWNEFAVFNASSAGTMLNRKVSSQGTKTAGQTWRITLEITFS